MLQRWSRAYTHLSRLGSQKNFNFRNDFYAISRQSYKKASAAVAPATADTAERSSPSERPVNLDKMFWSKPCSLALDPSSPLRVEEPKYEGFKHIMLKLLLFYSKQSKSIRGANVVYMRITSQVDSPTIYEVFNLEKTFKTTFSLIVLHMWLCLRRLKAEGKAGVEFGQYLYDIYNHDVELRVSKAGVNLLLTRWMKDLEKIFYGNIVAYDAAMLPEAKPDELQNVIWRNVFSDDGSSKPDDAASRTVQALARYTRREVSCLSLTDEVAMFSGNFMFTPLKQEEAKPVGH
ncbi:ubiquinol-cytochrome-c reductase complex assembly factor 1 isoform X1 [Morus notabilis]|uniref:ubiquinol-cytochrome-c reductase complex assembly factor 1 isoform X1 n=2 Tax=Morus notabilis TaxID=981085 RepID=UPI000CED2973|nr:ubiquinol-cytochrome-c reductase complex assembly factor 1 isoform X1 [Morus notabilis]XP_024029697.1 ubiquinol-cytochrome-c reductase complex assembly factor 1 isoform X1 [Morus notabilis]XP_024029698.1 ubiquinol-cytochrome-c reductase complex assembly factor 1 isoform X1 [Morus notabilis]